MKERPILFSSDMVRAILDGRKTQTRRIAKIVNSRHDGNGLDCLRRPGSNECIHLANEVWSWRPFGGSPDVPYPRIAEYCSHGQPGDRLWVREEHACLGHGSVGPAITVRYSLDGETRTVGVTPREYQLFRARKSPLGSGVRGRFMYRSLSRIQLEITGVRVERLNQISKDDAIAEGISRFQVGGGEMVYRLDNWSEGMGTTDAVEVYRRLWQNINGPGSWAANPWVWVIEFRKVEVCRG